MKSRQIVRKYNIGAPLDKRRSGVLLHITSLPGPFEQGVLGEDAYRFVDYLEETGFSVWQTLPLVPTHGDGSPYQSLSVHAGNPLLIDLSWLVKKGWLTEDDLHHCFADVFGRSKCIDIAFNVFRQQFSDSLEENQSSPEQNQSSPEQNRGSPEQGSNRSGQKKSRAKDDTCSENDSKNNASENQDNQKFLQFIEEQSYWLNDYTLYCALKKEHQQKSWVDWPEALKQRDEKALSKVREKFSNDIFYFQFEQYVFFSQWLELKEYANKKGIFLFGDLPIFVAHDSADVWAQRQFFKLDNDGFSEVVAGVPPDYFSATGQRWGNPHYQWDKMEGSGFSWWLERIKTQQLLFDVIRIDHFRGLEASWEISANEDTAINGSWVKCPGEQLLTILYQNYPGLALIAEDLGIITEEVDALREQFNLPGMKIIQFAFSGEASNPYIPHNHEDNSVVYTGTHDNDTTLSWLGTLSEDEKHYIREYYNFPYEPLNQVLMSSALASVAKLAILPMQDLLHLGEGHRMNTPGTTDGNWQWRFFWEQLTDELQASARQMNSLYGR